MIRTSARIHRRMLTFASLYTQHRKSALPLPLPLLVPTCNMDPLELRRLTYPLPPPLQVPLPVAIVPLCSSSFLHKSISFIATLARCSTFTTLLTNSTTLLNHLFIFFGHSSHPIQFTCSLKMFL